MQIFFRIFDTRYSNIFRKDIIAQNSESHTYYWLFRLRRLCKRGFSYNHNILFCRGSRSSWRLDGGSSLFCRCCSNGCCCRRCCWPLSSCCWGCCTCCLLYWWFYSFQKTLGYLYTKVYIKSSTRKNFSTKYLYLSGCGYWPLRSWRSWPYCGGCWGCSGCCHGSDWICWSLRGR